MASPHSEIQNKFTSADETKECEHHINLRQKSAFPRRLQKRNLVKEREAHVVITLLLLLHLLLLFNDRCSSSTTGSSRGRSTRESSASSTNNNLNKNRYRIS